MTQLSSSSANSEVDDNSVRDNDTSYTESLAASSYVADNVPKQTTPAAAAGRVASLSPDIINSRSVTPTIAFPPSRGSSQDYRLHGWERPPVAANRGSGGGFAQPTSRIITPVNDRPPPKSKEEAFADWFFPMFLEPQRSVERVPSSPAAVYYPPPPIQSQQPDPWSVKPARTKIQGEPKSWKTENRKSFSSWCDEEIVPQRPHPNANHSPVSPWSPSPELPPEIETYPNSLDDATFLKKWGVPRAQSPIRANLRFASESNHDDEHHDGPSADNHETRDPWGDVVTHRSPSPSPVRSGNSRPEDTKGFFIPPLFGNSKGYYLKFHKLLRPGAKKLDWDATKDPYSFAYHRKGSHVKRLPLETYINLLPATQPPIKSMCLILDEINRFVRVRTFGPNSFVTIGMVLRDIYDQLVMAPITPTEWFDLAVNQYSYRMKAIATKKREEIRQNPRAPPLKWADMLEGRVYFGGIVDFVENPQHGEDLPTFIVHFED